MRRAIAVVALAGLAALLHAPEVRAGAGQAGDQATGKISGPAVGATIVINPTHVSPGGTKGQTTVRLSKGSLHSSALFQHDQATAPATDWILGCDGSLGAQTPGTPDVGTLTDLRFVNNRIRSWMPDDVMTALFGQLGVSFDGLGGSSGTRIPVITDVDNAVCTGVGGDFFLSFSALIQFEDD